MPVPIGDTWDTWETPCPVMGDGKHCTCWYDGEPCCGCKDDTVNTLFRPSADEAEED